MVSPVTVSIPDPLERERTSVALFGWLDDTVSVAADAEAALFVYILPGQTVVERNRAGRLTGLLADHPVFAMAVGVTDDRVKHAHPLARWRCDGLVLLA